MFFQQKKQTSRGRGNFRVATRKLSVTNAKYETCTAPVRREIPAGFKAKNPSATYSNTFAYISKCYLTKITIYLILNIVTKSQGRINVQKHY